MRCECCDRQLNDVEATARFADSGNYVGMCTKCRRFLPKNIKVILRPDLVDKQVEEDEYEEDSMLNDFNLESDDGDESWK